VYAHQRSSPGGIHERERAQVEPEVFALTVEHPSNRMLEGRPARDVELPGDDERGRPPVSIELRPQQAFSHCGTSVLPRAGTEPRRLLTGRWKVIPDRPGRGGPGRQRMAMTSTRKPTRDRNDPTWALDSFLLKRSCTKAMSPRFGGRPTRGRPAC